VLSMFLAGPSAKTLPVRIWEELRVELTPVVAVAATLMMALALVGWGMSRVFGSRRAAA
jgi:putative spermidine/putrescine transport system permease protein